MTSFLELGKINLKKSLINNIKYFACPVVVLLNENILTVQSPKAIDGIPLCL